ncbi:MULTISPECIES: rhomboid family intramembrane serine protease [Halobacterium]|uniref:rhomboid family intramembrane serine protease n=1 Tax=Halobacterium TaxID=2239 RepID=UPI001965AC7A|nr:MULTISPECIES: rhomboid family intramembrane serine protease [Halobacterium]MDL0121637.1 rhomboid family intramembrane serine protease [Halobacterium salinarum]QRY25439.1 rhomboid family intramembrane serine protease [Halobacterium sp. BOL4-2]
MHVPSDAAAVVALTAVGGVLAVSVVPRFRRARWLAGTAVSGVLAGLVVAGSSGLLDLWRAVGYAAVVVLLATGTAVFTRGPGRDAVQAVRSRLLFGVPWGTLLVAGIVAGFYTLVQRGPDGTLLVVPFISWSYAYPLGVLTSPIAHANLGHVTGNLIGTLALAPVAEYAFSHYPTARGTAAFGSWRTNPYVRAGVVFPAGVLAVALLTSVFSWGAAVGFSGVVFAFAGFALLKYPLATVVAVAARDAISVFWRTLLEPVTFASASQSFGPPWWAGVAVQGHLFGFLLGALAAVAVLVHRDDHPNPARVWLGAVVIATSLSLWAVWWYGRSAEYVLFRAGGLLLVVVLAVVFAVVAGTHSGVTLPGRGGETTATARKLAAAALIIPVVTMAFVAVPVNLTTVQDANVAQSAVSVNGYEVTYAENATNKRVAAVDIPYSGAATNVSASGVIVANPDRGMWTERVGTDELAFRGDAAITVGGLNWRETVGVHREGWVATGGQPVYNVYLRPPDGGSLRPVFASANRTAAPVLDGRHVRLNADAGQFSLTVLRNETALATTGVPAANATATAGGLTFEHTAGRLLAHTGNTTVTVAHSESYD